MTDTLPTADEPAAPPATDVTIAYGTGALWAFTRDAQIDLGTYVGVHGDVPVATPFVGFSFRR